MIRVLVVQHEPDTGPGWFGDWLTDAGVELVSCHAYREDVPDLGGYDGLLVLGGAMAPAEDDRCPWLPVVRARLAEAVETGLPTLGICLGAQLLSLACGGAVRHGVHGPELGVLDIATDAGVDPLFGGLPPTAPVVQWHWEEISALPPGAVLLAGSSTYEHQLFRVGDRAWGVQGHPEVTPEIASVWARDDSPLIVAAGRDGAGLVAEVTERAADLTRTWRPVAAAFARVVQQHAQQHPRSSIG